MKRDLTAERLRELLDYDRQTGVFSWRIKPNRCIRIGAPAGRKCNGYVNIGVDGREYGAHRLAWLHVHGEWPEHEVDHRDLNRLNNALANLRAATRCQNGANLPLRKDNALGVKGVCLEPRTGKYRAQISRTNLGTFSTIEAASAAYKAAALERFGDFARVA